eukprot:TRINITY_DN49570_c0_g1_i1.p3 TRINITY_DN49570_c0_g1~~TRINITY_DN49570_c0_g1_i1.p3  ORF type:complete len:173 (-),score=60.03 TRINITY_DN49570_c0_g1_i1:198-716(-)
MDCRACCGVDDNNLDVVGGPAVKMPGLDIGTKETSPPVPVVAAAKAREEAAQQPAAAPATTPPPAPTPAAAAPTPEAAKNDAKELEIVVEKRDQELGLDVDFANERTLVVVKVKPGGLLDGWNKANPDKALMENDHIVSINGAVGTTKAMLEKVQQGGTLTIKVDTSDRKKQ